MRRILAAFLLVLAPTTVAAAELALWNVSGPWKIQTDTRVCVTMADYKNGMSLGFSMDYSGQFHINVVNSRWNIPEDTYQVAVTIDNGQVSSLQAKAKGSLIWIPIRIDQQSSDLLRYGQAMHVKIGSQTASFYLTGTSEMLPDLYRCAYAMARRNEIASAQSSNPFLKSKNPFEGRNAFTE